jgi:hypothetical protein
VEAVGWPVDVYLEDTAQDAAAIAAHLDTLPPATKAGVLP